MPGTKGIVTIGTMSESMAPPTVRPNPGPIMARKEKKSLRAKGRKKYRKSSRHSGR